MQRRLSVGGGFDGQGYNLLCTKDPVVNNVSINNYKIKNNSPRPSDLTQIQNSYYKKYSKYCPESKFDGYFWGKAGEHLKIGKQLSFLIRLCGYSNCAEFNPEHGESGKYFAHLKKGHF